VVRIRGGLTDRLVTMTPADVEGDCPDPHCRICKIV
jgi:hypothetical protein